MNPSDPLLLADITLCCWMYPACKVDISQHLAIPGFPQGDHTVGKPSADAGSLCSEAQQISWPQVILKCQPPICLHYRSVQTDPALWHCKPIKWTSILGFFFFLGGGLFFLGQCTKGIKRIMAWKIKPKCTRQHQTVSLMNILSYLWIYNGVQFFLKEYSFWLRATLRKPSKELLCTFFIIWHLWNINIKADVKFGQNLSEN